MDTPKSLIAPMLFAVFAIDVIKSMLNDLKWIFMLICLGFAIWNIQTFYGDAPTWARAIFSFYVFSKMGQLVMQLKPVDRDVMKMKKTLWESSL